MALPLQEINSICKPHICTWEVLAGVHLPPNIHYHLRPCLYTAITQCNAQVVSLNATHHIQVVPITYLYTSSRWNKHSCSDSACTEMQHQHLAHTHKPSKQLSTTAQPCNNKQTQELAIFHTPPGVFGTTIALANAPTHNANTTTPSHFTQTLSKCPAPCETLLPSIAY